MIWFYSPAAQTTNHRTVNCRHLQKFKALRSHGRPRLAATLSLLAEIKGTEGLSLRLEMSGLGIQPVVEAGSEGGTLEAVVLSGLLRTRWKCTHTALEARISRLVVVVRRDRPEAHDI